MQSVTTEKRTKRRTPREFGPMVAKNTSLRGLAEAIQEEKDRAVDPEAGSPLRFVRRVLPPRSRLFTRARVVHTTGERQAHLEARDDMSPGDVISLFPGDVVRSVASDSNGAHECFYPAHYTTDDVHRIIGYRNRFRISADYDIFADDRMYLQDDGQSYVGHLCTQLLLGPCQEGFRHRANSCYSVVGDAYVALVADKVIPAGCEITAWRFVDAKGEYE